jgi:hypothetical protein
MRKFANKGTNRLSHHRNGSYESPHRILAILSGKNMLSLGAASRAAVFCGVAFFTLFRGQPVLAEDVVSDQCLRFSCQENYKKCNSGGHLSAVTVEANIAVQGCPSGVTVWYDRDQSSKTPFKYFSCGCRHPDITKITK